MKITEQNFVQEISKRNEEALSYVMLHYGGLVKSVTRRYLNVLFQYEEECISDVFFAVWTHIDSFQPERNPFANWIAGIARLKALDYKRKYARQLQERSLEQAEPFLHAGQDGSTPTSDAGTGGKPYIGTAAGAFCETIAEEFSRETEEMLACLKPRDRELFVKLYVEEKTFDEIAAETGTDKSVLYNRLSRSKCMADAAVSTSDSATGANLTSDKMRGGKQAQKNRRGWKRYAAAAAILLLLFGAACPPVRESVYAKSLDILHSLSILLGIHGDISPYQTIVGKSVTKDGVTVTVNELIFYLDDPDNHFSVPKKRLGSLTFTASADNLRADTERIPLQTSVTLPDGTQFILTEYAGNPVSQKISLLSYGNTDLTNWSLILQGKDNLGHMVEFYTFFTNYDPDTGKGYGEMANSTLNDTYAIATEAESLTLTPYTYNRDNPTFVNGTIEYEQIGEPFTIMLK